MYYSGLGDWPETSGPQAIPLEGRVHEPASSGESCQPDPPDEVILNVDISSYRAYPSVFTEARTGRAGVLVSCPTDAKDFPTCRIRPPGCRNGSDIDATVCNTLRQSIFVFVVSRPTSGGRTAHRDVTIRRARVPFPLVGEG